MYINYESPRKGLTFWEPLLPQLWGRDGETQLCGWMHCDHGSKGSTRVPGLEVLLIINRLLSFGNYCTITGLPKWLSGEESTFQFRRHRLDPWVGKIPGVGNGNSLQSSCLGNPMDRGAWSLKSIGWERVRHNWATEHTWTKMRSSCYVG